MIRGEDDVPDFGDLDGLARLVRQAIETVGRMGLPDHQRQAWIAETEVAFQAAGLAAKGTQPAARKG